MAEIIWELRIILTLKNRNLQSVWPEAPKAAEYNLSVHLCHSSIFCLNITSGRERVWKIALRFPELYAADLKCRTLDAILTCSSVQGGRRLSTGIGAFAMIDTCWLENFELWSVCIARISHIEVCWHSPLERNVACLTNDVLSFLSLVPGGRLGPESWHLEPTVLFHQSQQHLLCLPEAHNRGWLTIDVLLQQGRLVRREKLRPSIKQLKLIVPWRRFRHWCPTSKSHSRRVLSFWGLPGFPKIILEKAKLADPNI